MLYPEALRNRYADVPRFYDGLYASTPRTWEILANRGPAFNEYVRTLVSTYTPSSVLDIGCGTGGQLAVIAAPLKTGVDISVDALKRARCTSGSVVCAGYAESLPLRSGFFDVAISIGVLTHVLDDAATLSETRRVLAPEGHALLGIYLPPTSGDRCKELLRSACRTVRAPGRLLNVFRASARRFARDSRRPDKQPIERNYERPALDARIRAAGFCIERVIRKGTSPGSQVLGDRFSIYVLRIS